MKYIDVSNDYVANILRATGLVTEETAIAPTSAEVEQEGINEETAEHFCPLCESQLEEAISEDALKECVDFILNTINEMTQEDGEVLEESDESDELDETEVEEELGQE